mmetsp:Transcript_551/g.1569  ORF Transcript_551/g.1569 Transcript_551/m.1569 type:complete len:332 (+) Transcript_551:1058-2053(+)
MHIGLRHVGQLVIIDVFYVRNVEAPRRHIGGHKDQHLARFERRQRPIPLSLTLVAMDRDHLVSGLVERLGQLVGPMFGPGKDQRPFLAVFRRQFDQKRRLLGLGDEMHLLGHFVRRLAGGRHFDAQGFVEVAARDLGHLFGHGGRKQHGLAVIAHHLGDLAQVVDKAQVQHLIGLVEHQKIGLIQTHSPAIHQIKQPARRRHQNIDAFGQALDLWVDGHAAHHDLHLHIGHRPQHSGNLPRQFAGGRQDQTARRFGGGATPLFHQPRNQRDAKGRRLAGAGLGQPHHVAPVQRMRNGLGLNGGRIGQTHLCHALGQRCGQVHHVKIAHGPQ